MPVSGVRLGGALNPLSFWGIWRLLPAFSGCSVGAVPRVDVFLMYLWGGRWSPRLTLPPSCPDPSKFLFYYTSEFLSHFTCVFSSSDTLFLLWIICSLLYILAFPVLLFDIYNVFTIIIKIWFWCLIFLKNILFSMPFYLFIYLFLKFIYFIYLFLAVLGPRCCVLAFSSCSEQGLLFVAVRGLLILVVSLAVDHRL